MYIYVCVCIYIYIYTHTHMHSIYTRHIFIYLSISGHLSCFNTLAITNNATISLGVHVSF